MAKDNYVVVDIETKNSFFDVGAYDASKLDISVVGIYVAEEDKFICYDEHELDKIWPILERATRIIGFNIIGFDYPVMQKSYHGNLSDLTTLDMLYEFKKTHNFRIKLDSLAKDTLGTGKSGDGLQAIKYYEEGKIDELKKYCLDDVRITRDLFLHGRDKGEVYFQDRGSRSVWQVDWKLKDDNVGAGVLTLPF